MQMTISGAISEEVFVKGHMRKMHFIELGEVDMALSLKIALIKRLPLFKTHFLAYKYDQGKIPAQNLLTILSVFQNYYFFLYILSENMVMN